MPPTLHALHFDTVHLDNAELHRVTLAGSVAGPPVGSGPINVLMGGITASPYPLVGPDEAPGWWHALGPLIGEQTVLAPALPGSGTRWDDLESGPRLGVIDLAELIALWLRELGVDRPVRFVGASVGGLVGLALASRHPELVDQLVSISAGLRPDGWGTGVRHLQRKLVQDGLRNDDVATAMRRARQLGMLTYRGREELDTRFGRLTPEAIEPPVASYLEHHGKKFADGFSPHAFLLLSEAIDRCSFGQSPEALRSALSRVDARVAVVGVRSDLLFPWELQEELYRELRGAGVEASLHHLQSVYGHDAFLADQERLVEVLRETGLMGPVRTRPEAPIVPLQTIRVGMVGCGVVGQGLLQLLEQQKSSLAERLNVAIEIVRIAVRSPNRDRGPLAAAIPKTTDPLDLVADPGVDVVVEVAGGVEGMWPVVSAALQAAKPVVTANKALLAARLGELAALSHRTDAPLGCEAAVAAALPIMRTLSHRADHVTSVAGIVNGTCNYLLTRMEQDEQLLDRAIARAQELGLAEADPSADVDGHDAAAKLSVLVYRSFGVWVRPEEIPTRGIRSLTPGDCDLAGAMGFRIKLLAHAVWSDGAVTPAVEPVLLPDWHLLANVEEEYNSVYLVCPAAGDLSLFGKGAGGLPTATAVLGDLIDIAQSNSPRWPAPEPARVGPIGPRRHFLRVTAQRHPQLSQRIESQLRRAGLSVQSRASRLEGDEHIWLGWLLGPCEADRLDPAIAQIGGLSRVQDTLTLPVHET